MSVPGHRKSFASAVTHGKLTGLNVGCDVSQYSGKLECVMLKNLMLLAIVGSLVLVTGGTAEAGSRSKNCCTTCKVKVQKQKCCKPKCHASVPSCCAPACGGPACHSCGTSCGTQSPCCSSGCAIVPAAAQLPPAASSPAAEAAPVPEPSPSAADAVK